MSTLVSILKKFVGSADALPIAPQRLPKVLKKAGVKDKEVELSGILQPQADEVLDKKGRITVESLQAREAARTDVDQFKIRDTQTFSSVTLPGTNMETYRRVVYNDPRASGGSAHFGMQQDYSYHVARDIVNTQDTEFTEHLGIMNSGKQLPETGTRALRIQEIQSDLYNSLLANKSNDGGHTVSYGQIEQIIEDTVISPDDLIAEKQVNQAIQNAYNTNEATANEILDNFYNAPGGVDVDITIPLRVRQLENINTTLVDEIHGNIYYNVDAETVRELNEHVGLGPDLEQGIRMRLDGVPEDIVDSLAARIRAGETGDLVLTDDQTTTWAVKNLKERFGTDEDTARQVFDEVMSNADTDDFAIKRDSELIDKLIENLPKPEELQLPQAKDFPIPVVKAALGRQVEFAQANAIREIQIAINPEGIEKMVRSKGVQGNYETTVKNTAEDFAKDIGATTKMNKGYLVLTLPALAVTLPLYAQENEPQLDQDATFLQTSIAQGVTEAEAKKALFIEKAKQTGLSPEEAGIQYNAFMGQQAPGDATQLAPVEDTNYAEPSDSDIEGFRRLEGESYLQYTRRWNTEQGYATPSGGSVPGAQAFLTAEAIANERKEVMTEINALRQVYKVYDPLQEIGSIFSTESANTLAQINQDVADKILPAMEAQGVKLEYVDGEYFTIDPNTGAEVRVTPGILQELYGEKFEIGGSVVGGAMFGAAVGARTRNPYAVGTGFVAGGIGGSIIGNQLDYVEAILRTQEQWEAGQAWKNAVGAAKAGPLWEALGLGSAAVGKKTVQGVVGLYKMIAEKNIDGATEFLLKTFNMNEEEAREVIRRWENINNMDAPGRNEKEQFLSILPTTEPGGEKIIADAAAGNPDVGISVAREVNERAQSLLDEANKIGSQESAENVLKGIRSFIDETKMGLDQVEEPFRQITDIIPLDLDDTIEDAFEIILPTVNNAQNHGFLLSKMDELAGLASNITSGMDLLELRKALTGLKFSGTATQSPALRAFDDIIRVVDDHINDTASKNLEDGEIWRGMWNDSLKDYSELLSIQRNGLYSAATKPSTKGKAITAKSVANAFVKYGPSIDENFLRYGGQPINTYDQVMDALPAVTIREVESLITSQLTEKFTAGSIGTLRATDFPRLASQLNLYNFRSSAGQRMQTAVNQLADLYKTDVKLLAATGNLSVEQWNNFLATNPVSRLKMMAMNEAFNFTSQMKTGPKADTRAMINHVARLLKDPLNTKTTAHVLEAVKDSQSLTAAIKSYQAEYARALDAGEIAGVPRMRVYQGKGGTQYLKPGDNRALREGKTILANAVAREDYILDRFDVTTVNDLTGFQKSLLINDGFEGFVASDGQYHKLF